MKIKNVLKLKKSSRIFLVTAVALAAVLTVGLAVNNISDRVDTLDKGTKIQIPEDSLGNFDGKEMTLEDVRTLAKKGNDLLFEDLSSYNGGDASSNLDRHIMVYGVEGGYRLIVHAKSSGKPNSISLESIWESSGSGIDIRYEDVEAFLQANPSQDSISEQEAQDIAQTRLGLELESVSFSILADWRETADSKTVFAQDLIDSISTLDEPCWVLRVKDTAEWGGSYYAVGKKNGTIFEYTTTNDGIIIWKVLTDPS